MITSYATLQRNTYCLRAEGWLQLSCPDDLPDLSAVRTVRHEETTRQMRRKGSPGPESRDSGFKFLQIKGSSNDCLPGCSSDGELAEPEDLLHYRPPQAVEPRVATQFSQNHPSMDSPTDHCPEHPHKQQTGQNRGRRITQDDMGYSSGGWATTDPAHWGGFSPWMHEYESQSDSDVDRPEPDVVLDDLASRRFRSPSPATPANYAIPMSPVGTRAGGGLSLQQAAARQAPSRQNLAYLSSSSPSPTPGRLRPSLEDVPLTEELYEDSEDEEGEGEEGYADPIQDDLYTRRVGLSHQPSKTWPMTSSCPSIGRQRRMLMFARSNWGPSVVHGTGRCKGSAQRNPVHRQMTLTVTSVLGLEGLHLHVLKLAGLLITLKHLEALPTLSSSQLFG
ncbi:hypothetical protein ANANG_G00066080 [Anguilla anguilla]|uniref:Uncharacterized protein n=1 Tax=Anguilla anguilla TaxID=7936 RepID=A0A9D3MPL3_ANGAN|nr:hypothetical protein ANANG_G00066080 [Anguilla anguilla]